MRLLQQNIGFDKIIIKGFRRRARNCPAKVRLLYTIAGDREGEKTRPGLASMLPLL